ncbi:MAG: hypothetical protein ACK5WT_17895, partial [Betaproteobacteria bacterium]
ALAALVPGRRPTSRVIRQYVRRMVQAMRLLAGIRIEVRGRERLPEGADLPLIFHPARTRVSALVVTPFGAV